MSYQMSLFGMFGIAVATKTSEKKTLEPVYLTVTPSRKTAPAKPIKIAPPISKHKPPRRKSKIVKDWKCQECGRLMTLKQAEKAFHGPHGCPGCGGADIDLAL